MALSWQNSAKVTIVLGGGGGETWLVCKSSYGATWGPSWIVTWQTKTQAVSPAKQNAHSGSPLKFLVDPLWQIKHFLGQEWETKVLRDMSFNKFLLAVESRDLTQADKSIIRVSSFPKLFLNDKIYSYTKNNYLALGNLAKLMFWSILSFKNLQDQFFWWEVNLRGLRAFILQKVQASVVERQKKKFCYPSLSFGKEDTLIILLSAWDRSSDSTAKRNLSKDM